MTSTPVVPPLVTRLSLASNDGTFTVSKVLPRIKCATLAASKVAVAVVTVDTVGGGIVEVDCGRIDA